MGHIVFRQGASLFPDLFVAGTESWFFVECKNHDKIPKNPTKLLSKKDYQRALNLIQTYKHPFYLVYNDNRKMKAIAVGGVGATLLPVYFHD